MSTVTTANSALDPALELMEPMQDATVEMVEAVAKVLAPYSKALGSLLPASLPTLADIVDAEIAVVERVAREEWGYLRRVVDAARPAMGHRAPRRAEPRPVKAHPAQAA